MNPFDDYDEEQEEDPTGATCKRCGKEDLTWGQQSNQWRLFENGKLHKCDTTTGFDDET